MNKYRKIAFDLKQKYEETRLAWNASTSHEERLGLSERLNEILRAQYNNAAQDWDQDYPGSDSDYDSFGNESSFRTTHNF